MIGLKLPWPQCQPLGGKSRESYADQIHQCEWIVGIHTALPLCSVASANQQVQVAGILTALAVEPKTHLSEIRTASSQNHSEPFKARRTCLEQ